MIPVLYDESLPLGGVDHTRPPYLSLGKGKLTETVSCVIHEELNGDHYLDLQYPVSGVLYHELMNGGTLLVHCPRHTTGTFDEHRGIDLFDVRKKSLPIDGVVTFMAQHVSRRLSRAVVTSRFSASWSSPPFRDSVPNDFNGVEFRMKDNTGPSTYITPPAPKSALSCFIGSEDSIVANYNGDIAFSVTASGMHPLVTAIWAQHLGEDRGASVRFGVNMMSLDHTKDATSAYNAVVPYWDDGNGNITYVTGYVVQPTTPISPVMAVPLDLSNDFDSQPTEAQMVQAARNHLDTLQPWLGEETIKVDFVNDITDPHAPEILLGDTIHVYWGDADIATDLRVVAYDYDVLAERYISLELGTPQTQYVAVTGESYAGASGGGGGGGVDSDTPTATSGTLITGSSVKMSGHTVVLTFGASGVNISTSISQIGTIPARFKPSSTAFGVAIVGFGSGVCYADVSTSGGIRIRGHSAQSNVAVRFQLTWIV